MVQLVLRLLSTAILLHLASNNIRVDSLLEHLAVEELLNVGITAREEFFTVGHAIPHLRLVPPVNFLLDEPIFSIFRFTSLILYSWDFLHFLKLEFSFHLISLNQLYFVDNCLSSLEFDVWILLGDF